MEEKYALGIDFGTTYSCTCAWTNGGNVVILNELGERTTPSVVIFENKNKFYVGEETLNHLSKKNCVKIYEIKRLIGKKYSEIKNIKNYFAYTVEEKKGDQPIIKITFDNGETSEYTPEYIVSLILAKLIKNAEIFLNKQITDIVITVPADFTDIQRHAVKFSAESIPGIKVLKIINEPSSAALAYGFYSLNEIGKNVLFNFDEGLLGFAPHPIEIKEKNKKISLTKTPKTSTIVLLNNKEKKSEKKSEKESEKEKEKNDNTKIILVFDFGGGTFDVSIVEMDERCVETLVSSGDQMLGGGDFDNKLMEFCLNNFVEKTKKDKEKIKKNYKSMQRLKIACEQTKKILSKKYEDTIFIEDFYEEESISITITRAEFEELCKDIFDKLIEPLDHAIEDAKSKDISKIDEIILVGGSSKIPKVKEILENKFGENIPVNNFINPDEIVAYGAALCCEKLMRSNNELLKNFNYIDSIQHSYGIEVENGKMEILLPRGSTYPSSKSKFFHNFYDYQKSIDIKVYEGENKSCTKNQLLGKFTLENIPIKKKGELIIRVNLGIDINQIIKVSAYIGENESTNGISIFSDNPFTNKKKKIIVENLNKIEIDPDGKEKKLRSSMVEYSKMFTKMNNDEDKYKIIKNYKTTLIEYLTFLQENCFDIESDKYIILVEYLFKSFSYIFTDFSNSISKDEKLEMEEIILKYLKLVSFKKPFKLKQLIIIFENIKSEISDIFYSISIYCMEILKEKAKKYLELKTKNSSLVAINIYEECLNIGNYSFKDEKTLNLIDKKLKDKFNDIKGECEKNIIILSIEFHNEIENTMKTGKLFSDSNMDYDNLCLLSFNISQIIKNINSINNLYQNKEILEKKSIFLATIVKIEFLMKKRRLSLQNLLEFAEQSIDIVDYKLGNDYKNKEWYKEIVDLKNKIQEEFNSTAPMPIGHIENLREQFNEKFLEGEEAFLKFLVENYPHEEFNEKYDIIGEFRKNKKKLLKRLITAYNNYGEDSPTPLSKNRNDIENNQKKEIILEYLGNIKNNQNKKANYY